MNRSIFKIATIHSPFVLRKAAATMSMVKLFVSYLQYLLLRLELFADRSTLEASMSPQVCYIEKMLQLYISPQAVINPQPVEVILWREDDPDGFDVFIDDAVGRIFHHESEFGLSEFTVLLPIEVAGLVNYAKEIIDRYKLPGKLYTIILR